MDKKGLSGYFGLYMDGNSNVSMDLQDQENSTSGNSRSNLSNHDTDGEWRDAFSRGDSFTSSTFTAGVK